MGAWGRRGESRLRSAAWPAAAGGIAGVEECSEVPGDGTQGSCLEMEGLLFALKTVGNPSWCCSVARASSYRLKGPGFYSSQGHMPRWSAGSPVEGVQRAAYQ